MLEAVIFSLATQAVAAVVVILIAYRWKEHIMSDQQSAVDEISGQLTKVAGEITQKISDLEAQVAAGQPPDLTGLRSIAQRLDDIVPDAPVDTPDPEPTPEPEPDVDEETQVGGVEIPDETVAEEPAEEGSDEVPSDPETQTGDETTNP